jgi:hypothetical protein
MRNRANEIVLMGLLLSKSLTGVVEGGDTSAEMTRLAINYFSQYVDDNNIKADSMDSNTLLSYTISIKDGDTSYTVKIIKKDGNPEAFSVSFDGHAKSSFFYDKDADGDVDAGWILPKGAVSTERYGRHNFRKFQNSYEMKSLEAQDKAQKQKGIRR